MEERFVLKLYLTDIRAGYSKEDILELVKQDNISIIERCIHADYYDVAHIDRIEIEYDNW